MTARDRLVVMCIAAIAVLGAVWLLAVSPERKQAASLASQVSATQARLTSAEGHVAGARSAQAGYSSAYATLVKLGKAVPASEEVPSLVYELSLASDARNVDFSSIVAGNGSASGASSSAAASASAAGVAQMPFTFVFNGSFGSLYHLFDQLNGFTTRTASGGLVVNGRLLTIQSLKLAPQATNSTVARAPALTGTITATAYVLPAPQGLSGATSSPSPAGPSSTQAVSSPGAPAVPAPAIVRANP